MSNSFNQETIAKLLPHGCEIILDDKFVLGMPHQKIEYIYWLLDGAIKYYIMQPETKKEVLVCKVSKKYTPVGWNGLNAPFRFYHKILVSASEKATFLKVPIQHLTHSLENSNDLALLKFICIGVYSQLEDSFKMQAKLLIKKTKKDVTNFDNYYISPEPLPGEVVALFRQSPFLGEFDEEALASIAELAKRREYERGEEVYKQGEDTRGLFILIQGEVDLLRLQGGVDINPRSISTPGFIFGWSTLIDSTDLYSAITSHKTSVYFIEKNKLSKVFEEQKSFAFLFYKRLIWLVGNHLTINFIRYVGLKSSEQLAMQNLIEKNKSRLKLSSPLHQVTHLIKHNVTKPYAYEILHKLNKSADPLEKYIASLSLDLLKNDEKEVRFLNGLQHIYEVVAEETANKTAFELREACAVAAKKLFQTVKYQIDGIENLPKSGGNIFIYNHLLNHPYYTLNNNFQITIDSHFISSLILYDQYGAPGIRTVRIGKGQEYAHQYYYERLGYINVFTKDSDNTDSKTKDESRSIFYSEANDFLDQGTNLIISPEGTSYTTEESPGPFKSGAFFLAANRNPEPYIVPLVLSNFDRRITNNVFYCKILAPFKVSEQIEKTTPKNIKEFVRSLQEKYVNEVVAARKKVDELINSD